MTSAAIATVRVKASAIDSRIQVPTRGIVNHTGFRNSTTAGIWREIRVFAKLKEARSVDRASHKLICEGDSHNTLLLSFTFSASR